MYVQSYPFSRHYTRKTKFFLKKHKTFSSVSPDFNKFEQQRYTQVFFSSKFCPTFFIFLTPLPSSISPQPSPSLTLPSLFPSPSQTLPKLKQLG